MQKTKLTFWSGLNTIGGNIVEICYGKDRVIFDFGLVYNPAAAVSRIGGKHRQSYVLDMLKLGAIPSIDGLYAKADLAGEAYSMVKPDSKEDVGMKTAVFISHLHLDHMGAVDAVSPAVPVYMSGESLKLYKALTDIGEGLSRPRELASLSYTRPVAIGDITVTAYQTDHDIYGAASFLIETPDLTILYSGDIRLHGQHPEYNDRWLETMAEKHVDILLMEGTAFRPEQEKEEPSLVKTEAELPEAMEKSTRLVKGLVLFNFYHRNIDRIGHMISAAKQMKRTCVFEPKTALLADAFLNDPEFQVYDNGRNRLSEDNEKKLTKYRYVTTAEINRVPQHYLLQNSFENLDDLLDLCLDLSAYIHANGMPLGAFDPNYHILRSFLDHFGIEYLSFNVSGHAGQSDILQMIDRINPELLIPWHSHYPELVKPLNKQQRIFLPEAKQTYVYENNQLVVCETKTADH
ncbi:ribonuclease J [Evansella caseinilytica]|uniref:Ribonuclease J n=1 Tax=Evansella caseinilytica TaxID=1503961 RepID=A0A1H3SKW0_9BACI|nr:MBL fold metallo-hydrolase [Evansella caseinilytica]SDZ38713.1 ribonuclease J [Evansella caseinilytica]